MFPSFKALIFIFSHTVLCIFTHLHYNIYRRWEKVEKRLHELDFLLNCLMIKLDKIEEEIRQLLCECEMLMKRMK